MSDRKYYSKEAEQSVRIEKAVIGLSSLIAGLGLGGAVALLFAPEDGDSMRQRLTSALEDGSEKGKEKLAEVIQSIEAEYPGLTDRISQAAESLNRLPKEEEG
jgi:gas vesicle protein